VCFAPPLYWKPGMRVPKAYVRPMMARKGAPGQALGLSGTTGTKKIAVILINFTTGGFGVGANTTRDGATGLTSPDFLGTDLADIDTYFTKFKEYYTEASYSQLTLNISFMGSNGVQGTASGLTGYTADKSMSFYGSNVGSQFEPNSPGLIREAINKSGVTSAQYDGVMVIHAGYGNESSSGATGGADGDIWSVVATFTVANGFTEGALLPAREARVTGGSVTGTLPSTGVYCHEFGHLLGLPDLYDTASGRTKYVGKWDIMDFGTWNGSPAGGRPSHYSSWSKVQLGWVTPTKITTSSTVTIQPMSGSTKEGAVYRMDVPGSTKEYFLIEYRRLSGFDDALPGAGTVIWHVDDAVGSFAVNDVNASTYAHPRLKVVEADKNDSISNSGTSEAGDAFALSTQLFTSTQSDAYGGSQTGITVSNFTGAGASSMSVLASLILATTSLDSKKAFNYPNPVRNSASTTLRLVFSRPITSIDLRIYTVAGELVRSKSLGSSDFSASKSKDYEWVYEYVWDLNNHAGAAVAPGVYVYAAEGTADSTKQALVGKLAIIK